MTVKGAWGWAIGGLVVLGSWFGPSLADSLVKEGKLPDWLATKIAGWLALEISIPAWSLVLILVCIGVAGTLFFKFQSRTKPMGARLNADAIASTHRRCMELEEISTQLKESNISLHQQLQEKTQALEALQADKLAVSDMGFKVLAAVASRCRGSRITVPTIASAIPVGQLEARAAIDALVAQKLLHQFVDSRVMNYRFTSEGRQYYVKQMEQQKQV